MIDIFARPLGALLNLVYSGFSNINLDFKYISAYALAIIFTTIIFKLILLPLTIKQTRSMKKMQEIQPKIQEIQKKYKDEPQTVSAKTLELYKEHKVNPLGGCLPILIQLPVILAYFRVMQSPIKYVFENEQVYEAINKSFLWVSDISLAPSEMVNGAVNEIEFLGFTIPLIAVIASVTTYFSNKSMATSQPAANAQAASTQKTMNIVSPIIILMFGYNYAIGLTLYWSVSNIFQILQQYIAKRLVVKEDQI